MIVASSCPEKCFHDKRCGRRKEQVMETLEPPVGMLFALSTFCVKSLEQSEKLWEINWGKKC